MQLHLNVFCNFFYALTINGQYNWDIGLGDIFRCYKLIPWQKGKDLYTLAPDKNGGSFFLQRKNTENGWKDHAIVVSGEWQSADL